ncbi:phenylalanine--tRNA ligase subunit beta [Lactiplantibacillus plantarum]|uniref:Phenylalanine--tRNA ligase beta subunit n=4 Tax=Lactiplantibacillus plantarum TaxID=1590 RepID=SYFB_LACPL|nr:phenylalanine--tRNA ligase subunit beta [Lactiplantibacillus plantarum]Q88WR2.1 RecName: Full=Phenylalanine--tRNA ligase beta subunit; AltName: Full=Phenylalanyl-tRNA synthetase beta subunit; Short=PheRS [Lactiplantibacillus plantarum WCFS1]ALC08518.1 phenylalanyl-tRNA synthetase subunit beta [Lactiplantibacillus plantarum]ALF14074.1 phenylalanyl-tRNA synthase subunit beta [Lactiplantibacillus plantarum]MCT3225171.1 phenylalanine--tRNA ligase subunit beta [Lactiplantibacillus plantarum]MCT3
MRISTTWLRDYLKLDIPADELAEKIERTAVEVDGVIRPSEGLKKVVVGHVLTCEPHPDSDHLHVCQVDVGESEPLQIVCGAPNVAAGEKVIVALPNSWIGGHTKIKKSKMRGVPSNGMLCALDELGFDEKLVPKEVADGIFILPDDATPGDPVFSYLGMDDEIIDMSVTPNRGDMLSMNGTAHELAAIYDQQPTMPKVDLYEDATTVAADDLHVAVAADEHDVPMYKMRLIKNVTIKPSPLWLQIRIWNAGMRPINNVVDATNYILMQYGQPLHAFDFDQLNDGQINVRLAKAGEHLTTLDGEDRELLTSDLLICSGDQPICLAGTMGGLATEVTDQTTTIALEGAVFDAVKIRKTAHNHDLHSEASMRYERGIDHGMTATALDAAAAMIAELGDGQVASGMVIGRDEDVQPTTVTIDLARINHVLGTELSLDTVSDIFKRLDFPTVVANETFTVTVPSRRWDIHIPADLIEEIARLYGYDNLPATLPTGQPTIGKLNETQQVIRDSRKLMESAGLTQAISYSLTTETKSKAFALHASDVTKLDFPMSSERTTLRLSLVSGLLDDLAYNNARKEHNVALYEEGRVFYSQPEQVRPKEIEHIAGAITGSMVPKSWGVAEQPVDFFQIKGIVAGYLKSLALQDAVSYVATAEHPEMHPGRTADIYVGDQLVGFVGEVHPTTAKAYKIRETYVFELDLTALIALPKARQQYQPISKFPSITRDVAMLIDDDVTNATVVALINKKGGAHLRHVQLFDVYNGSHVPAGKKSLAYTLTYQDQNATLVDDDVTTAFEKVLTALTDELGAEIR